MPDNSKITLKQLIDAMNKVKEYIDTEISLINVNNTIPCTGIVLDKDTLSFTTNATQTLVATVTPTNCTQPVVWSVSPEGIVTVDNGLVTAVANGEATVTATCGSYSATCAVTVSGLAVANTTLYELTEAKTFNGTSDFVDTGITLLTGDNINKDWTMLIDFTPTTLAQASIIHCMTETSGWPGLYLSLTATGGIQAVLPNNKTKNNIKTVSAGQRIKFVIKKVGTTFTVYDSVMSALFSNDAGTIIEPNETLLLGAIQELNGQKYRLFKGTIHKFKLTEGNMSDGDCLNWMA